MDLSSSQSFPLSDYQPCQSYHLPQGEKYRFYSLAVDSTGQRIAIGSEKNLHIIVLWQDGGDPDERMTMKKMFSSSKDTSINTGSVSLAWCPDTLKSHLVASSNSNNIVICDVNEEKSMNTFNKAHMRHITSLAWNSHDSNVLASGSGDSFIKIWDLRDQKNSSSINTQSIISQIAWNPHTTSMIASSHQGEIKIWDTRKLLSPLTSFTAHIGSIPSIAWHHHDMSTILTCGSDKSIKIWDASPPNKLLRSYQTGSPCCQSKFLPFTNHHAISSISQKGDNDISIWTGSNHSSVLNLVGHTSPIIGFDWRIKEEDGEKKYFIVSIGKDHYLRMWKFTDDMINNIVRVSSPESKSSSKRAYPLDLNQELIRIVQEKFSNLTIERTNIAERVCVLNIENRKIIIIVSFPSVYPSAPPSFEILIKSSPSTNIIKVKLKKELDRLSSELLETKKPFLYQLLKKFSEYYGNSDNVQSLQDVKDFIDSPQIEKRTHLITPFRLSDQQSPSPTKEQQDENMIASPNNNSLSPSLESRNRSSSTAASNIISPTIRPTRGSSFGSNNVPLPPSIPYNNGNQSILFEMYVVKATDTLTGISLQFNMPRDVLLQTNRLFSEKLIPGTILWVYKKKSLDTTNRDALATNLLDRYSDSESEMDDVTKTPSPQSSSSTISSTSNIPSITINNSSGSGQIGRRRSSSSTGNSVNIDDLFKPVKEEFQFAIPKSTSVNTALENLSEKYNWCHRSRFTQIPKENILKEELVCFMKNKRIFGTLTLTPYQFIFQSDSTTYQIFADYPQIISCKYFPNKTEWIAHLSKDWNKEQYLIRKKNNENDEYDKFIQSEISKLNEMEEEKSTFKINGQDKKVLVFPCIYLLVHKDKIIQTLFLRGFSSNDNENSVYKSFSFLKKLIVDSRESSPAVTSPVLGSTPIQGLTLPPPIPISLPVLSSLSSAGGSSFDEYSYSPKLLRTFTKDQRHEEIILTSEFYKKLRHYLPLRIQVNDLKLIYNSTNDGVSFQTFFRKMKGVDQSIMLIKDDGGYIFGAYLSEELKQKDSFFGDGETFLFSIHPELKIYKWTKENDFFIYACPSYLVVGGGSSFGLFVDTDFTNGYSAKCETFGNNCLSHSNDFRPLVIEFWSLNI